MVGLIACRAEQVECLLAVCHFLEMQTIVQQATLVRGLLAAVRPLVRTTCSWLHGGVV
jgi:hypothetical protein